MGQRSKSYKEKHLLAMEATRIGIPSPDKVPEDTKTKHLDKE